MGGEIEIELKIGVRLRLSTAVDLDYVAALAHGLGDPVITLPSAVRIYFAASGHSTSSCRGVATG